MFAVTRAVALAVAIFAVPATAATLVHIDSAGIYSPGTVRVTSASGTVTNYATLVTLVADKAGGTKFDVIGFCVDLYHSVTVGFGAQLPVSLNYHRGQLTTDGNGVALSSAQAQQIGGLATLGFSIAAGDSPDRFARLAAIQQAIWTIEYPTLSFDGSGGLAGQQAFADAFVAAAPGLKGKARVLYADNFGTQGFVVAGVPEPASWALMISGFGLIGVSARRRRAGVLVPA